MGATAPADADGEAAGSGGGFFAAFVSPAVAGSRTLAAGTATATITVTSNDNCLITPTLTMDGTSVAGTPFTVSGTAVTRSVDFTLGEVALAADSRVRLLLSFDPHPNRCNGTRLLWGTATTVGTLRLPPLRDAP